MQSLSGGTTKHGVKVCSVKSMKVEVLVAAVEQEPGQLVKDMKLDSDAIIINQCDQISYEEREENGHRLRFYGMAERGVGLSRNSALMRAEGEICLFSDQDIVYEDGYEEKIVEEFEKKPKADMLLFNIEVEAERRTYHNEGTKRVHWYNCGRYGAVSFAVRREALLSSGVTFSLLFGGGARYSNGEDSLFLLDFLKKGYRVYTSPVRIGWERPSESTWFSGYHEKFFFDRGVLYHALYGRFAGLMALRYLYAHKDILCTQLTLSQALLQMKSGIREGILKGRRR